MKTKKEMHKATKLNVFAYEFFYLFMAHVFKNDFE